MDDYESNCNVLRSILGSCLSYINKSMPLWYYGILLPEVDDDILSYLFNLTIVQLKKSYNRVVLSPLKIIVLSVLYIFRS